MKMLEWLASPRRRLDIVAGIVDGILNALILAAGKILQNDGGASVELAVKVGVVTASTTMFVFFVAHYADLRSELVHAERELNLLSHGRLATTQLGRQAMRESLIGALVASICGLAGVTIPLLLTFTLPGPPVLGLIVTIGLLAVLGTILARSFYGSPWVWAIALMTGGALLTFIGAKLDIIG
jgi:predicted membrane protein (TIGR00267 family)